MSQPSGRAIFVRVYWMFLGFIPMVASVAALLEAKSIPSAADLAFGASVLSITLARLYDVTKLDGRTAEGELATLADWRRHASVLVVVAAVVWVAIRLVRGQS